jgi:hypothetical protein
MWKGTIGRGFAPDLMWGFTPLIASGVHSPSWNRFS